MDGETDKIHAADRQAIKQHIVGLMLKSPERVQNQVSVWMHSSVLVSVFEGMQNEVMYDVCDRESEWMQNHLSVSACRRIRCALCVSDVRCVCPCVCVYVCVSRCSQSCVCVTVQNQLCWCVCVCT